MLVVCKEQLIFTVTSGALPVVQLWAISEDVELRHNPISKTCIELQIEIQCSKSMPTLIHQLSSFSAKCHLQICLIQWQVNGSEVNSDLPQARIYLYMLYLAES